MFPYCIGFLFFILPIAAQLQAAHSDKPYQAQIRAAQTLVQILQEQPDSIEQWSNDRAYISPERIQVTRDGVFISHLNSSIEIPELSMDQQGIFILCSKQEAQEHYDKSRDAFIDAVGHSVAAGAAAIEFPAVAAYEIYNAVESWKECGKEYCEGVKCEKEEEKND